MAGELHWREGDLHVHDDHSSDGSLPRQISNDKLPGDLSETDQIDIAEHRRFDFLPLTDHRTYDQHYDPLWHSDKLLLIPGEEANGSPHATVHGAVDSIVQGADAPGAPPRRKLQQSIWDAHAQDANWSTAHPDDGELNDDGTLNDFADAVGIDLIEVWNKASNAETELDYAESRWNAGFRTGVSGASDDHFKELWPLAGPGEPRTGVLAPAISERAIVGGLRSGRTRVRADDLAATLELTATYGNGLSAVGGDEITAAAGTPVTLTVSFARSVGDTLSVYRSPGRSAGAWQQLPTSLNAGTQSWSLPVTVESTPTWYRAELRGPGMPQTVDYKPLLDNPLQFLLDHQLSVVGQLRAVSAPIFLATAAVEARPSSPLPADAGGNDGASLMMGAKAAFAGFPDLAMNGDTAHLVAEQHDALATRVSYRRRAADGTLSAPRILSGESQTARFPRIAVQGSDVWVAWQDESAGAVPHRPSIVLRHSNNGGNTWQATQTIRAIDGRALHPALAISSDGLPVVAWQEIQSQKAFDIYAEVIGRDATPINLSGEGKIIAAANLIDTRSARYPASVWPALAVSPGGAIAVAWQDDRSDPDPLWTGQTGSGAGTDPDDWQTQLRVRPTVNADWGTVSTVGSDDRADRHPSITYTAQGRLVAAWDSKLLQSSGANLNVQSAYSDDGGQTWSAPTPLYEDVDAMSQWPRLGRDTDGNVRAVWYDGRSADWRWRIATSLLSPAGVWQAGQILNGTGNNTWPVTANGRIAFATTRHAARLQRDLTQQIALVRLKP